MHFSTPVNISEAKKGDTVCRTADWLDVVKFFLFNFVIHALTVVTAPGAKPLRSAHTSLTAILLPFSGAYRAFQSMAFYRWEKEGDLNIALRAQALCTTIPSVYHPTAHVLFPALNVIEVHGQHSVPPRGFLEWTGLKNPTLRPKYHLCRVPWWFAITPLKQPSVTSTTPQEHIVEHNPMSETKISCDYNVMKIFAAILQIFSGLFQIFQARGGQLERYGYSAYSLTVIPYVLMSLVNLVACLCIPQYPMMYIVHYGGKQRPRSKPPTDQQESASTDSTESQSARSETPTCAADGANEQVSSPAPSSPIDSPVGDEIPLLRDGSRPPSSSTLRDLVLGEDTEHFEWEPEVKDMVSGVVGVAYGEWEFDKRDRTLPHSETSTPIRLFIYFIALIVLVAPYLIMLVLTNFDARESTWSQRTWIMAWLIMGQIGGLLSGAWENEYWRVITRLPRLPSAVMTRFVISGSIILLMSVGTIGGFVVVGNMILEDRVCTVI